MTENKKIDQYFTPVSSRSSLKRVHSSPELQHPLPAKKHSGEMATLSENTIQDLMNRFGQMMDTKLAAATKDLVTKTDLNAVAQGVEVVKRENEILREEVLSLRAELHERDKRLDFVDNSIRRNNLIFYGLTHDGVNNLRGTVESFVRQVLNVAKAVTINEVVCLGGRAPNSGLLVKFGDHEDIMAILANTKRLRNTSFGINRDYSTSTRKARKCLFALQDEIKRKSPSLKTAVRSEFLLIDGRRFSWSDPDGIRNGELDGLPLLNSLVGMDLGPCIGTIQRNFVGGSRSASAQSAISASAPSASSAP